MTDAATPPWSDELSGVFSEEEIYAGTSVVVAVDRDGSGHVTFRRIAAFESVVQAIEHAGVSSSSEAAVLVAAHVAGQRIVVARYGISALDV